MANIFLTELAEDALSDGKAFDAVAFGIFKDMLGREIELSPDDADEYIANTQAAIDATTTEGGELVGLPIDEKEHNKGDAAGWIIGIKKAGDLIQVIPKWTEVGREVISKGIRRFFSGTIDIKRKVILGGTLTNWPATRNEKGHIMLRPIELSTGLFSFGEDEAISEQNKDENTTLLESIQEERSMAEELETQEKEIIEETPAPEATEEFPADYAELLNKFREVSQKSPQEVVKLLTEMSEQRAQERVAKLLEENQRDWEIVQLSAKLTTAGARGLPVNPDVLSNFLMCLDDDSFDQAVTIFQQITNNGLVEFTEVGHSRRIKKKQLPKVYHLSLAQTLKAGNSIKEYFETVPELGQPSEYDLSQFEEAK